MAGNKVPLFRLYKKQGKNGEYWTGTLGAAKVIMFPNKYKESDRDADLVVYAAEKDKPQQPNRGYDNQRQAPRGGGGGDGRPVYSSYHKTVTNHFDRDRPVPKDNPGGSGTVVENPYASSKVAPKAPIKNHAPGAADDPDYESYFGSDPGPEEQF